MIKEKNFIILFLGRLNSNFADSLYAVATALLVYQISQSTFYSGFALFLTSSTGIFQILFSPIIDRINIKRFLIYTQLIQALLLLLIPILNYFELLSVTNILIIMPLVTLINQFIYPSQISLLPRILKSEELLKGNTLFTLAYQGSDAIFNALAGVLITLIGIYSIYYVSSISFIMNSILFLFLGQVASKKIKIDVNNSESRQYKQDVKEAFKYIKDTNIFSILIGFTLINLLTSSIYANLPAFSSTNIIYSLYLASSGVGVLLGSFLVNLKFLKNIKLMYVFSFSSMLIGISWLFSAYIPTQSSNYFYLSIIFFLIGWIPIGIINILSQTIVQTIVPSNKIGLVMGTVIGLSTCLSPIGALLGGVLGSLLSPSISIMISSIFIIFIGIYWSLEQSIKQLDSINKLAL